jgi:hypothetical protein
MSKFIRFVTAVSALGIILSSFLIFNYFNQGVQVNAAQV